MAAAETVTSVVPLSEVVCMRQNSRSDNDERLLILRNGSIQNYNSKIQNGWRLPFAIGGNKSRT